MRYAWDQFDAYFGVDRVGAFRSRMMRIAMARMAKWDAKRQAARTAMSLSLIMLRAGSADTIIETRQ